MKVYDIGSNTSGDIADWKKKEIKQNELKDTHWNFENMNSWKEFGLSHKICLLFCKEKYFFTV